MKYTRRGVVGLLFGGAWWLRRNLYAPSLPVGEGAGALRDHPAKRLSVVRTEPVGGQLRSQQRVMLSGGRVSSVRPVDVGQTKLDGRKVAPRDAVISGTFRVPVGDLSVEVEKVYVLTGEGHMHELRLFPVDFRRLRRGASLVLRSGPANTDGHAHWIRVRV